MGRLRGFFRAWRGRKRFDADLADEVRTHIELRAEDLVRQGLTPEAAHRRARVEFGSAGRYGDEARDERLTARLLGPFADVSRDVVLAARRLIATPLFTVFAVASLSIGAGATTSVYSVVYDILWRPTGISDPDRVVVLATPRGNWFGWQSLVSSPDAADFTARQTTLSSTAVSARLVHAVATAMVADTLRVEAVSGAYFNTVGVRPAAGRLLDAMDDAQGGSQVAVLGHRFWRAKFSGDPGIVGRTISVGGRAVQVVGVAQEGFAGLRDMFEEDTAVFMPLRVARDLRLLAWPDRSDRDRRDLALVGRLKEGRTRVQANAEAAAIGAALDRTAPMAGLPPGLVGRAQTRAWTTQPISALSDFEGRGAIPIGKIFVSMVGLVLLIACTNLANLMLGRGSVRQHELVVRRALGASRWRLIRELLVEGALILGLSALGTYVVAQALLVLLAREVPISPGTLLRLNPSIDAGVLTFAVTMLLLTFFVFALVPALSLTRGNEAPRLAGSAQSGGFRWRARSRLIAWQVSISVALFLIAIVSFRFIADRAFHDPGIDIDRLALGIANTRGVSPDRASRVAERFLEEQRGQSDTGAAAVLTGFPFGLPGTPWVDLTTVDRPFDESGTSKYSGAPFIGSTAAVFDVLGVDLRSGRGFDASEIAEGRNVVVLSARTASQLFGDTRVVGREVLVRLRPLSFPPPPPRVWRATIVGVAADTDSQRLRNRSTGVVYAPLRTDVMPFLVLAVRSSGDATVTARTLPAIMRGVDPEIALPTSAPARLVITPEIVLYRHVALVCGVLAGVGLLMSMTGLYGVLALLVSRRTREFGLRIALGGTPRQIASMVLRDGARPVLDGLIIGLLFGVLGRGVVRYSLAQASVQLFDPAGFSIVAILLAIAAVLACYLPARRASRVDPNVALREN